jgi:hypothetical protein
MRLPITLAALAATAFLALTPPAQAGGLRELDRIFSHFFGWLHHDAAPAPAEKKAVKAKAKAKAAPKKM